MNGILVSLLSSIGPWAVGAMALVVFAETGILAGFFLPGDSMLFSAGVLVAAGVVHVPLLVVMVVVAVAAFLGDQVGYAIGRRFGPRVLSRPDSRFLTPKHVERAEEFFAQHGPRAVIVARFVPFARTFTPVIAGVGSMNRRTFTTFNLAGALLWSVSLITAGAVLGGVGLVAHHIELVSLALVALSMGPVLAAALRARRSGGRPVEDQATVRDDEAVLVGPAA